MGQSVTGGKGEDSAGPSSVEDRILGVYGDLTPGERRLADIIISAAGGLSEYSSTELADQARVSKATAARFFKRLGYASFKMARLSARENRRRGSPLEALKELTAPLKARGSLGHHLAKDVDNLTRTAETLDPGQVDGAVNLLAEAERVLIVGFRNSYALAAYAFAVLNTARPNVILVPAENLGLAEMFAGLGPKDVILAVGFRRRPRILNRILTVAREHEARTILLTDTSASKTAKTAHIVLLCENQGAYLFDSYVAGMSLLNFLCSTVAMERGTESWRRLEDIENLHEAFDDLVVAKGKT